MASKGRFKPGESGNPGGRPKEVAEVKALAREHTVAAINKMVEIMNAPKSSGNTVLAAACAILDRGYGRPAQSVDLTTTPGTMSDAEVEERAIAILQSRQQSEEEEPEQ